MREHHALRVAGAARGVLHQAERFRIVERRQRQRRTFGRQRRDGFDAFQRLDLAAQQHRERAAFRYRDQHARAGIAQDHDLPAHVLFELRHAGRRIDRHRHGAGIENAEERREEIRRGRQHHGDAIARHDVAADQPLRDRARGGLQVAIAHRAEHGVLVLQHRDVDVVRMLRDMPVEHLGQCLGVIRLADQRRCGMHRDIRCLRGHRRPARRVRAPSRDRRPTPFRRLRSPAAARGRSARCAAPVRCARASRCRDRGRGGSKASRRRASAAAG